MWGPLARRGGDLGLSLGSPQCIQSSLHIVRWKMSLHLRHCREIRPYFESGHLGVHSTWGRKDRVPLTYLLLRECSSSGACGELAHLFSRRQGIILILRRYQVHRTYLNLLYWNWILYTWDGCCNESLEFYKGSQALALYGVDCEIFIETMQGTFFSSQFPLGNTELFCMPEVTSVFFSYCDSVLGDSLEFNPADRVSLHVW